MSKYKIGFWNYMDLKNHQPKMVGEWEELGYNYAMTPYYFEEEDPKKFMEILEDCEKRHIDVVIKSCRCAWEHLKGVGEEQFRKDIRQLQSLFGGYKCVHSFFVGDEPTEADMPIVAKACKIVKEEGKGIKPFLSVMTPISMDRTALKEMLIKLIVDGEMEYIVYNCYSQCMVNEDQRQQGMQTYFEFLNMFREIKDRTNVDVWISLLGVGHWYYRAPSQADMRWQLNTAALYGVNGFVWFFPYEYKYEPDLGAMNYAVNIFGDKTQTYWWQREEDLKFRTFVAPYLEDTTLKAVYQHWQFWLPMGGTDMFVPNKDEVVENVMDDFNRPIIVSRFEKADGTPVVAVCNGSQTDMASVHVSFKAPYEKYSKRDIHLAPGGVYLFDFQDKK
ncbi:MAG: hypothetical protein IJD33_03055 [Clostridia bacterium]|nr:hypothetical protein [Clostridia bacterium]